MACKLIEWLKGLGHHIKTDGAEIAVHITEGIQEAAKSGILDAIATGIQKLFPSVQNIPTVILDKIKNYLPRALAVELAIEGIPDNATPDDVKAFGLRVAAALGIKEDKSKLWSTVGADVFGILEEYQNNPAKTFAVKVETVEKAYVKIKADLDAFNAANPDTAVDG